MLEWTAGIGQTRSAIINAKSQTVKRVEVQDVMQIGKYFVFKEMKVANMAPDKNDIALSTTYIDIQDGKEGSGL